MNLFAKRSAAVAVVFVLTVFYVPRSFSHCQVPCGIYDDQLRLEMMAEHIATIEKSMKMIDLLTDKEPLNANQIVRWIQNKERHADKLSHIVTYYFMTQRIKPPQEGDAKVFQEYTKKLTLLHKMLIHAMKAKQTTDLSNVEMLKELLEEFRSVYPGTGGKK